MARFPLSYPPGVFRNGTDYQSQGRFYDAWGVRWHGKSFGPIGGSRPRGTDTVDGTARAAHAWKDNSNNTWIGIASDEGLFVSNRLGAITDITPESFTVGVPDATGAGGYGSGAYGAGAYGTPRPDVTEIIDATQPSLDTFGENLIFISPSDRSLYKWELDDETPAAVNAAAPEGDALVTTADDFIFVLGTDDPRTITWCDQRDDSEWTPDATNQAGSFTLHTPGRLMCGRVVSGGTLLLTDEDAWLAANIGGQLVFGFDLKGKGCGAISRQCMVPFEMSAAWMSPSGFWFYNGYTQKIECDVWDYIQRDINMIQASKIWGVHNSAFSEIEWYYCSAESNEIDRCVIWNYRDKTWNIGRPARLCGTDAVAGLQYPVRVGADGLVYDHEVGFDFDGVEPFAEGGQITIGNGDNTYDVMGIYPDEITVGDVIVSFNAKNERGDTYTEFGPYTASSQTDTRFNARQVRTKFTANSMTQWRVGTPALEIKMASKR